MSSNGNEPAIQEADLASLDTLARDLRIGIGLSEEEVQRLVAKIFARPQQAERGLRKLIKRGGLEHALAVLERDSLARAWHFGSLRIGLRQWRRREVEASLLELPEALRKLQHLLDRQHAVLRTRSRVLNGMQRRLDDEPDTARPRGRSRKRDS